MPALYDYDPDDLPADGFNEQPYDDLRQVDGVTERKAAFLVDTYENRATLDWATRRDTDYIREHAQIDPTYLRDQLRDHDLLQYHRRHPSKLAAGIPDRASDYLDRFYPLKTELDDFHDVED